MPKAQYKRHVSFSPAGHLLHRHRFSRPLLQVLGELSIDLPGLRMHLSGADLPKPAREERETSPLRRRRLSAHVRCVQRNSNIVGIFRAGHDEQPGRSEHRLLPLRGRSEAKQARTIRKLFSQRFDVVFGEGRECGQLQLLHRRAAVGLFPHHHLLIGPFQEALPVLPGKAHACVL